MGSVGYQNQVAAAKVTLLAIGAPPHRKSGKSNVGPVVNTKREGVPPRPFCLDEAGRDRFGDASLASVGPPIGFGLGMAIRHKPGESGLAFGHGASLPCRRRTER